ncbi:MAG: hypothetical protein JW902_06735, partial [Syntrophaceae bacterium]|nr:hypothetical protein [Syntrophaceae bacterium]
SMTHHFILKINRRHLKPELKAQIANLDTSLVFSASNDKKIYIHINLCYSNLKKKSKDDGWISRKRFLI